jgi:flotillin
MQKKLLALAVALGLAISLHAVRAEENSSTGTGSTDTSSATTGTAETANTGTTGGTVAKPLPLLERQKQLEANKAGLEAKRAEQKAEMDKKQTEKKTEMENKKNEREKAMVSRQGERAKQLLEQLKHQLEKLSERVDKAKELTDTDKNDIGAKIDAEIAAIEALKEKTGATATADEIKALTPEIKDELKKVRGHNNIFMGRLLVAKLGNLIDRTGSKLSVIEAKIAEIKSGGKDTSALDSKIAEAKSHLAEAKTIYADAKAKYIAALGSADLESTMKEAANLAKQVNGHLQSAHRAIQDLIPMINKLVKPAETGSTSAATTTATQ